MADEVTDCSNKEHLVIWVDGLIKALIPMRTLLGFTKLISFVTVDTLVTVVKNVLIKLNIPLSNARAQCYDGVKNMCGIKNGVSNKILSENPKAFFRHCFGHALKLVVGDMVKNVWI